MNNLNYFVPISSQTGKNPQYNLDIKTDDKKNRLKGSLRFPYMMPVPPECLFKLDIKSISDTNVKIKISKELAKLLESSYLEWITLNGLELSSPTQSKQEITQEEQQHPESPQEIQQ